MPIRSSAGLRVDLLEYEARRSANIAGAITAELHFESDQDRSTHLFLLLFGEDLVDLEVAKAVNIALVCPGKDRLGASLVVCSLEGSNLALRLDDPIVNVLPTDSLVGVGVMLGQLVEPRIDGLELHAEDGILGIGVVGHR